jgi:hypothetical protein
MSDQQSPTDHANALLQPFAAPALAAFAKVRPGKQPLTLRALGPLAMLLLLEALGLASLLTPEVRRAAWAAARPPGRSKAEPDYDPTNDSDEQRRAAWAAARADALEKAYQSARRTELEKAYDAYCADWRARKRPDGTTAPSITKSEFDKTLFKAPDRVEYERQWGERNPIDESSAPHTFDVRAQVCLLDAMTSEHDLTLGAFVSEQRIRSGTDTVVSYDGHTFDFAPWRGLAEVAIAALRMGWIAYYDVRGAVVGVRLLPPSDGVRLRLRSPLANVAPYSVPLPPPPELRSAFLSLVNLRTGTQVVQVVDRRLDLHGCRVPASAAARAASEGWGCVPTMRGKLPGLLFSPPPNGWSMDERDEETPPAFSESEVDQMSDALQGRQHPTDPGPASTVKLGPCPTLTTGGPCTCDTGDLAPVCPRCLDVTPGTPAGDLANPHPGPFLPELCTACALATSEPVPQFAHSFLDEQPEPDESAPPSEKTVPTPEVKRKRGRPKGSKSGARPLPAEAKIRTGGKRARS